MARMLKVCELESLPVLSYLNKITELRQKQKLATSVFDPYPYVCLGYTSVLLMTSKDVYYSEVKKDGSCSSVFRKTRGLFSPLELTTRFCPTDRGWRDSGRGHHLHGLRP